jgi:hypothetical protein
MGTAIKLGEVAYPSLFAAGASSATSSHLREEQRGYEGGIYALNCAVCSGLAFHHALPELRAAWRTDLTGRLPSPPAKAGFSDLRNPLSNRLGAGRSRTFIDLPMHVSSPP